MQDRLGASPAYHLLHTFWVTVDWIYPPYCGGCHKPGSRWCADCEAQAVKIDDSALCPVCGIPQSENHLCSDCKGHPPRIKAIRSWAVYQGAVREAIHRLKFHSDLGLSEIFALKLMDIYIKTGWNIDLITAVPLSRGRMKDRGFNQSGFIARSLALALRIPYYPVALKRIRETNSQVGLKVHERQLNVNGAFIADQKVVGSKNILIIDDVTTTGATLSECSKACLEKNAYNVYGLTIARAVLEKDEKIR
jgi:competence protein ComFC